MYTEAGRRAAMKYQKANYDSITFRVRKGEKERYRQHAESMGTMLTPFIVQAIEEKIARDLQK